MNWQYIIVILIGIACIASVGHRLWRLFYPKDDANICGGCKACGGEK